MEVNWRTELEEILDHWGEEATDEDVCDLPKFRLRESLAECPNFKLYRYMPPDYFNIRNIETQTIHLSCNGAMNDVFEGLPKSLDDISYVQLQKLENLSYMTCFSETNSNLLMWGHYAQQHKGFCVEYDLQKLMSEDHSLIDPIGHLFPIVYRNKRQPARDLSALAKSLSTLNADIRDHSECTEPLNDILPLFLVKSKDWEYEKEWRIIYSRKQMYDLDDELLYGGNISFKCISAVYLGYRVHPEIRKNIQEICKRISFEAAPVKVYHAGLSTTEYKIEYRCLWPCDE